MKTRSAPVPGDLRPPTRHGSAVAIRERDRLRVLYPGLVAITIVFGTLEAIFAVILRHPTLGAASVASLLFASGVAVAGREIRRQRPDRARAVIAISLTVSAAFGALLIPGLGLVLALLPLVSVILVLPYMLRPQLLAISIAALASTAVILVLDAVPRVLPEIGGLAGVIFRDAVFMGIVVLVLAAVADFAIEARESHQDLGESNRRLTRHTAARFAIVASLRELEVQSTPEATAALITGSLSDQPLVDVALVLEDSDNGLTVLAAAGPPLDPILVGEVVPATRARYLLERSASGAWAEMWSDRPGPGLEDELMTKAGIKGQAFAPIGVGGEVVGLISIATTDADEAMHLIADLPSVSESAALAEKILAPALLARRQLRRERAAMAAMIDAGAFWSVFQPVVDLASGTRVGFEALTRFAGDESTADTFDHAVRIGLGIELEAATLSRAIRASASLPPGEWLGLNVSAKLLGGGGVLPELLADQPRAIVLEVTEHELIDEYGPLHVAMRALGPNVRIATDDTGAGVANFRHLMNLRPNIVKVDVGLVRGVNFDVSRQAVIAGLVQFAAVTGALVIAEGIETIAEAETVKRLGVGLGQGYLFGRAAAIEAWDPVPQTAVGDKRHGSHLIRSRDGLTIGDLRGNPVLPYPLGHSPFSEEARRPRERDGRRAEAGSAR
jgi:EAL domain-containing protein (putative c-di-GMP-specific phosphodiesterase class I)